MKTLPTPRHGSTRPLRALELLGSLRLAVGLLTLFTLCLALATGLESAYGARLASDLVYRSWWFTGLMMLLAGNILGAAVKKYPWRRHQVGFLITHAGLLVLLGGALLTVLFGVEGQMILIDAKTPELQQRIGVDQTTNVLHLDGVHEIEILRMAHDGRQSRWTFQLQPGVLAWSTDEHGARGLPWLVTILDTIANPFPGQEWGLEGDSALRIDNWYPSVERDPESPLGFRARQLRPGVDLPAGIVPACRGTLKAAGKQEPFIVALGAHPIQVRMGRDLYRVGYHPAQRKLDFHVTLQRAWQLRDPGSDRPAWFQSDVILTEDTKKREQSVSMNNTLAHGPYKVYQANYRLLIDPRTGNPLFDEGRPVSLSGLTVAHDPGLWLKYIGSFVVVSGIALMFSMRGLTLRWLPRASPVSR